VTEEERNLDAVRGRAELRNEAVAGMVDETHADDFAVDAGGAIRHAPARALPARGSGVARSG
jgi:hypothetical protein